MRKIDVSFSGGEDTIIYSTRNDRFFSYEMDSSLIHELYGGKQYHISKSGLSGHGYLTPDPDNDMLIFGYYRTDAWQGQHKKIVGITGSGQPIFGYAPIKSHEGIDSDYPFVLTDG